MMYVYNTWLGKQLQSSISYFIKQSGYLAMVTGIHLFSQSLDSN